MFGDNFTAERRTTAQGMLAKVVYARMHKHLLPNDRVPTDLKPEDAVFNALIEDAEE